MSMAKLYLRMIESMSAYTILIPAIESGLSSLVLLSLQLLSKLPHCVKKKIATMDINIHLRAPVIFFPEIFCMVFFMVLLFFGLSVLLYSHGVVLARIPVLGLYAFNTSFAHMLVAPYMQIGKASVFLNQYGDCQ